LPLPLSRVLLQLVGLYAAFIVGLITAVFGGRPGMISGATGALAVVMVALVAQHGVQYLFATVILMGILQLFAGVMRWGKVHPHGAASGDAWFCQWIGHCDWPCAD
jgi:MFS superfamily sulfate permease-like transporter